MQPLNLFTRHVYSRRILLTALGTTPLLVAACSYWSASINQVATSLLADCETDIAILQYFLNAHINQQDEKSFLACKEALRLRKAHADLLNNNSPSRKAYSVSSDSFPTTSSYSDWLKHIRSQLQHSAAQARTSCLSNSGSISALAASISAACSSAQSMIGDYE